MGTNVKELHEQLGRLVKANRSELDAIAASGELDGEAKEKQERRWSEIDALEHQIASHERQERIEQEMAERQGPDLRDAAPEAGAAEGGETAEHREQAERVKAYRHYLRTGEARALQADASEAGGYTVPASMADGIIRALDDQLWIRQLSSTTQLTSGDSLGMASLDADPEDGTWSPEVVEVDEDTAMDFGKRTLTPHLLAKRIKVSRKLLRASAIGIDSLVQERLAYKFGVTQEKAFLTGSGAQQPLGIFTASADGISTSRDVAISASGTTTAPTANEVIDVRYSLKESYVPNATWVFHRDVLAAMRKLRDDNNQYLWQPGLAAGTPGTLLDIPYRVSEYAPNTLTASQYIAVIGDFRYYQIVDALNMEIQVVDQLYAANNQIGYIGRAETDAMPVLAEAFVRGQLAAS